MTAEEVYAILKKQIQSGGGTPGPAGVGIQKIEKTGTDGLVDTYTITYTNGQTTTYTVTNGADGPKGEKGDKGDPGEKGNKGDTGETGPEGPRGIQGPQGPQGERGPAGPQGPQGEKGDPFSIAKVYISVESMNADYTGVDVAIGQFVMIDTGNVNDADTGKLYVKGNSAYDYVTDLSGAQGIQGPIGPQGEQGPAGPQGEQGPQGIQGEKGEKGDKGDTGETGPAGKDGAQGPKGDTGEQGPQGPKGDTGATPNIQIGTVQTLEPGQQATASMSGTPENPLLNLGIPQGYKGDPGEDAPEGESIPNGGTTGQVLTKKSNADKDVGWADPTTTVQEKRKASFYNSVSEMKADNSLKDGMAAVTLGYHEPDDGGGATYRIRAKLETDIDDGGSIHELNGGQLVAELIIEGYVAPEMFGAVGNNVNDDTEAIQKCLDYSRKCHKVAFLSGTYKTTSSIIIEGDNISIHGSRSSIFYAGINSAIIIKNCHSSYIHLGVIEALNGIGIEFQSEKVGSSYNFNQYINLYFMNIKSLDKCIYFNVASDANSGWSNEIRIFDGQLNQGGYGIYADAKNINRINNVTIQNVGIEGVSCGIFLANQIYSWNFLNLRYHEAFDTLIETQGIVRNVQFIGSGPFYYDKHCSLSDDTVLKVLSPLAENGGAVLDYSAYLIGDMVIFDSYRKYMNIVNVPDFTVDPKSPINFFLLGDNSKSLTLSKSYGNNGFFFFINEFYVNNASDNTDFIVRDFKGSTIISTLDPWSFYKFIYFSEIGWKVIKLNN